jgi:hypothetical protein
MREALTEAVYIVVVFHLSGSVRDTVGPFYSERSAEEWARRNLKQYGYRITPLLERGLWEAEQKETGRKN